MINNKKIKLNTKNILKILEQEFGLIKPFLNHKNGFEFLIAVILSAQTTDNIVNQITPDLFKKYPTPEKLSKAQIKDIENLIKKVNYYKTKARNIQKTSEIIFSKFKNKIPSNLKDLLNLPGVGNKVANVILADLFKKKVGIVVDTHVKRVSFRIGWTNNKNPSKIEQDLKKIIPKKYWINLPKQLILVGRIYCKAKKPLCDTCPINKYCLKRLHN